MPEMIDLDEITFPASYYSTSVTQLAIKNTPPGINSWVYFRSIPYSRPLGSKTDERFKAVIHVWIDVRVDKIFIRHCENTGIFSEWKQL